MTGYDVMVKTRAEMGNHDNLRFYRFPEPLKFPGDLRKFNDKEMKTLIQEYVEVQDIPDKVKLGKKEKFTVYEILGDGSRDTEHPVFEGEVKVPKEARNLDTEKGSDLL